MDFVKEHDALDDKDLSPLDIKEFHNSCDKCGEELVNIRTKTITHNKCKHYICTIINYKCYSCGYVRDDCLGDSDNQCKECIRLDSISKKVKLGKQLYDFGERYTFEVNIEACVETYPCTHYVRFRFPKFPKSYYDIAMKSQEIRNLYLTNNKSCPDHFKSSCVLC